MKTHCNITATSFVFAYFHALASLLAKQWGTTFVSNPYLPLLFFSLLRSSPLCLLGSKRAETERQPKLNLSVFWPLNRACSVDKFCDRPICKKLLTKSGKRVKNEGHGTSHSKKWCTAQLPVNDSCVSVCWLRQVYWDPLGIVQWLQLDFFCLFFFSDFSARHFLQWFLVSSIY